MDHKIGNGTTVSGKSTIPNRTSRHRKPKEGEGDFADWLGEWIVSLVVFAVKSVDYTREQVDKYWPSEESLKGIYEWVERRPRLASLAAIQAVSMIIPVAVFLTFAFWVVLSVLVGAFVVLLGALGLGLCIFIPIILSTIFVTSLVWVWLYSMWVVGSFAYGLYAGDRSSKVGKADIKSEHTEQENHKTGHGKSESTGTDGSYDIPNSTDVQSPSSRFDQGTAGSPSVPAAPPPTKEHSAEDSVSSITFDESSDDTLGIAPPDGQMDDLNWELEESKRLMAEMDRKAPPKPAKKAKKQPPLENSKVIMDIERSLG